MKLAVPFFNQTTSLNCGPTALKMVLAYFGEDKPLQVLEEKTEIREGKGISTIQIAIAATLLGHKAELYSKNLTFNEGHLKHEFYQKHTDISQEQSQKWMHKAQQVGVYTQEKMYSLDEVLAFLTEQSIPIILLDWNVIMAKQGYQGHFVPIIGYDDHNVFIHNHGLNDAQASMAIPKTLFDKARKADGTDEDFVVIYKK